eukprot:gene14460-14585_t
MSWGLGMIIKFSKNAALKHMTRFLLASAFSYASGAGAETLQSALSAAYVNNPNLNAQRAATRVADENVPKATAGYRPTVSIIAQGGPQNATSSYPASGVRVNTDTNTIPRSVGLTVQENIWNGNRTDNSVIQAESLVLAQRETLRNTEQNVFQDGVTYYMNVLRDSAIYNLQKNNVDVLKEQLRQTQDRFKVGEVTRTDVAQAEASLAKGQSDQLVAESNLKTSMANYHLVVGKDPTKLDPVKPASVGLPKNLDDAIHISQLEHPAILASMHGVDSAELSVKIAEGSLYPSINLVGQAQKAYDSVSNLSGSRSWVASVVGQISVPLYDGGTTTSTIRQAKETAGQQQLQTTAQREQVRAAVVSSWGILSNSKAIVDASQAQVTAAELALNGVREEAKVGQRTTLDVLNAQQTLLNARVSLVTAQRDRVVASYALLSAIGRLSPNSLGLKVARYDPKTHFDQVKDKWYGLRIPDGR